VNARAGILWAEGDALSASGEDVNVCNNTHFAGFLLSSKDLIPDVNSFAALLVEVI
jgi:hypothetical protein